MDGSRNLGVKHFLRASIAITAMIPAIAAAQTADPAANKAEPAQSDQTAAAPQGDGIADIVVQATRRSEASQNIGLSVAAVGGSDLAKLGATSVQDVVTSIPNASVNYANGNVAFNLRGVGSSQFATNLDPPIATQVDEIYMSKIFMSGLFNFDLDHVEVAYGPQGTLFGRNSTGGTVNFFTRHPGKDFGAGGNIEYGNYNIVRGEAYLNVPLTDKLSARFSGWGVHQGTGYYRNTIINDTEGYERKWAVRGQLAYNDGANRLLLSVHYGKDTSTIQPVESLGVDSAASYAALNPGGGFANVPKLALCQAFIDGTITGTSPGCVRGGDGRNLGDNDPYTSDGRQKWFVNNRSVGGFLRAEHEFGGVTLTSLSGYENYIRDQTQVGGGGADFAGTLLYYYATIKQYTQELRLTSTSQSPWSYVLGAFYEHDDFYDGDYLTRGGFTTPFSSDLKTNFTQKVDAFAVFVSNNVKLTDTFKLIGGLRYNQERTEINGGTCLTTGSTGVGPAGQDKGEENPTSACLATLSSSVPLGSANVRNDHNVSFKVGYEWRPNLSVFDRLLLYGNVTTGFHSGGFNADLAATQASFTSLAPEEITAYEIGFKSELAHRRLRFNGALYHYISRNGYLRIDTPASLAPVTVNAAEVATWGAEFSTIWAVTHNLRLNAGGGWTNAHIQSDLFTSGVPLRGNRPVNSPKFTFNAGIDYGVPISPTLKINGGTA